MDYFLACEDTNQPNDLAGGQLVICMLCQSKNG